MNALWLSVTSRETKTKCLHRKRTVKLEEEKKKKRKKKVKHILWLHRIHWESHRRREISSSTPLRWISAGGRDVQLSGWVWEINSWSQRRRYQTGTSNCDVSSAGIRQTHQNSLNYTTNMQQLKLHHVYVFISRKCVCVCVTRDSHYWWPLFPPLGPSHDEAS